MLKIGDQVIVTACPEPWMGFVISVTDVIEIAFVAYVHDYTKSRIVWEWQSSYYLEDTLIPTGFCNEKKAREQKMFVELTIQ